jgi:hypothetical protein
MNYDLIIITIILMIAIFSVWYIRNPYKSVNVCVITFVLCNLIHKGVDYFDSLNISYSPVVLPIVLLFVTLMEKKYGRDYNQER